MCAKSCCKVVVSIVIVIALAFAIMGSVWNTPVHTAAIPYVMFVTRFFDLMMPILAVGALLKYLLCGHNSCNCGCCKQHEEESCKK